MLTYKNPHDSQEQQRLSTKSRITMTTASRTRQELGVETDINKILAKFGINAPQRQGAFGETIDYNMDLALATSVVSEALNAYNTLPQTLRKRYRTLDEFRKGLEAGQIKPADLESEAAQQLRNRKIQHEELEQRKKKILDREKQLDRLLEASQLKTLGETHGDEPTGNRQRKKTREDN